MPPPVKQQRNKDHSALVTSMERIKMAALGDESMELGDPADDTGQTSWNISQTCILISHFKENVILWDKRLKDNGNKAKTKKAMVPLLARFRNTHPASQGLCHRAASSKQQPVFGLYPNHSNY